MHHGIYILQITQKQVSILDTSEFVEHVGLLGSKLKLHITSWIQKSKTLWIGGPQMIKDLILDSIEVEEVVLLLRPHRFNLECEGIVDFNTMIRNSNSYRSPPIRNLVQPFIHPFFGIFKIFYFWNF